MMLIPQFEPLIVRSVSEKGYIKSKKLTDGVIIPLKKNKTDTYNKQTNKMILQLEPLFTIDELSNQIGINKYTLYKKIRENKFPKGVKINGRRKWKIEEIENYYKDLGIQVEIM